MNRFQGCRVAALLVFLGCAGSAWGSSAGFVLRAQGVDLGKPEEEDENGQPQPPRYHVKVERGKPFTLVAQGMAYPRGGAAQPTEPDKGVWRFDAEDFTALAKGGKEFDNTMIVVRLRPEVIGRTRIRFAGEVLGYKHTFDILVDIITPKKK